MKPLFVLITVFILSLFITRYATGDYLHFLSGRIAMSAMLLFTSIGHFAFTKGMTMMIPSFIPFKKPVVYLTGILEIIAAIALLIPAYQVLSACFLIILFILMLPANIYAAIKHINYEKGTENGSGIQYLWFRIPLQFLFIAWIYVFSLANFNS